MIDGYINNNKLDRIIFDIGATTSILSERVAKKYNMEIILSDSKVRLADDIIMNINGVT